MKQATKDRLFELGLRIPAAVEIRGDTAVQEWAAQAIAVAEARGDGAPASDDLGASFAELVGNRGEPVNLLGLLRRINEAAIELAELCVAEGDDAVFARLGELPAWPHFQAWASEALGDGLPEPEPEMTATAVDTLERLHGPAAEPQADGDPGGSEEAQAERTDPATGDVGETAGEFLDRKLKEDHGAEEPEPEPAVVADPHVPFLDPPSYAAEIEAIKERLANAERLASDHDEQISGLNGDMRAVESRATALEDAAAAPVQDHAPAIDALQERLAKLAADVDDNDDLIGGLSAGLTAVEARVTAQQDPPAEPGPVAAGAEQPAAG